MSVKQSLLAILDQGACYGYQLRAEFDRRTGGTWPLNVGQISTTLERLERDGLVTRADIDGDGRVFWSITDEGRHATRTWLGTPVERSSATRDELAIKLALAATLPGVDLTSIVHAQRTATLKHLQSLTRAKYAGSDPEGAEELAWSLVVDSMIFQTEAEIRWLDHTEQRLRAAPPQALALELDTEPARRGRPARGAATA
ncbi:PadR family transcriptional regulator [Microbacterium amylolyticum]|uniref:DNA-binding PadR family transcriptional regulator n=1 Tax=Microbacterium amylolyticum TaxID=936337 RepID=A0ABS4ZGU9_9MICO|nr:PadR family transcriptional regulator [Microbacterium amylolyticum]MBP2436504.1 DNA-binding PadR family transcriptional regulator [Microbacterium amylolyticum]